MFCFFGILGLSSFAAYFWYGLYSAEGAWLLVLFVPLYAGALFVGGRLFVRTQGANFRPLMYALIAFAALSSMPVFDQWLR
jgi:hypothetical protein